MCGIVGTISLDGRNRSEPPIVAMRDTMCHRGPDGAGAWTDGRVVHLAHRRLAIIDPTPEADQPFLSEDGSLCLVFNGEIYNHAAIRRRLEQEASLPWRTDHSDTEVLLRAYQHWGIACLDRFRGMFAFALWDSGQQTLWLVRDRLGVKPLYWTMRHGRLSFASEIKALLADPNQPRAVDEEALFHYLSFLVPPAPSTLFAGIRKLPCGSLLRVRPRHPVEERRWWDVWDHAAPLRGVSPEEASERVLGVLGDAVALRKVADVPVGVFLSGGIDSSLNARLFAADGADVRTFSIGYVRDYDTYSSELHHARHMAHRIGSNHHELLLSEHDVIEFLPRMVELQDEPIGDPVCVPVHYVSKLARDDGAIVCQVGEGSDELFCGYPSWAGMLRLQRRLGLPGGQNAARAAVAGAERVGRDRGFRFEYLQRAAAGRPVFWGGAEAFTDRQKRHVISPRLRKELDGLSSWGPVERIHRRYLDTAWERSTLNWMTYLDLNLRLPELLLMRVDKMSMGVSLECRVPFLDHELVTTVLSLPTAVRMHGGGLKPLLKRAVRGVLPDEIIDRPKQGFGVPVHELFLRNLGRVAHGDLDRFVNETDVLDPIAVDRLWDEGNGTQLWYLLNLALWWGHWFG